MNLVWSRRNVVVASLLAVALVVVVVALWPRDSDGNGGGEEPWRKSTYTNSGVVGDVDGDGEVSSNERKSLDEAVETFETVETSVAASKGGHSLLVTPASQEWWDFVTDRLPGTAMSGSSAPAQALWLAHGEGRTYASASRTHQYYEALHVAFFSPQTAREWVESAAGQGVGVAATFAVRGPVVTVTPTWVDGLREPYPMPDEATVRRVSTDLAVWRVDFDELGRNRARESADPVGYRAFWKQTGLSGTWEASSPRPDVAWVGRLDGFNEKQVDALGALAAVNLSTFECGRDRECRTSSGISEATFQFHMADSSGARVGAEELALVDAPDDMVVGLVLGAPFRGAVNASNALVGTERTQYVVTEDGMLSVTYSNEPVG